MTTTADPPSAAIRHISYGLEWPFAFFAYQRTGIDRLLAATNLLLADEMGLGKTIQAVAALRILQHRGAFGHALVVCPVGLVLQWRRQLRLWAPELVVATAIGSAEHRYKAWCRGALVVLTSYDALLADAWRQDATAPLRRVWDVVVIDEAQRIKNPKTDVAVALKRLQRRRSWAMTGTPLENHVEDLLSVLDFVAPGRFDHHARAVGLQRLMAEVQLRRRRREVLPELPPKLVSTVTLALTGTQEAAYRRAELEGFVWLRSLGTELQIGHILELILRLKQICNFCPQSDRSAKLDDLRRRLDELLQAGEKALIFTQFVEEPFGAKRLARELAAFRPLLLTGQVHTTARTVLIDKFQQSPEHKLMILSLRAGGVGLNLTAASIVFHFDRWWNPAVETQAEDRVHRIGQNRPVQIFAYLCGDTIEERIDSILAEKRELFADVIDGVTTGALARLDLATLMRVVEPTKIRD